MNTKTVLTAGLILLLAAMLTACGAAATPEPQPTDVAPTDEPTEVVEDVPTAELTTLVAPDPTVVASGDTPEEAVIEANVAVADVAEGERLFTETLNPTCTECHIEDPSVRQQGPALTGFRDIAGTRIEGQGAYTYAYNSIRYANDFIVDGFEADVMRVYDGILDDREVYQLIAYIWTLGEE